LLDVVTVCFGQHADRALLFPDMDAKELLLESSLIKVELCAAETCGGMFEFIAAFTVQYLY